MTPVLRHNRRMHRTFRIAITSTLVVLLAACRQPQPEIAPGASRMEWQGLHACTDCDAIDTRLVLSREDGEQRFEMVETFLLQGGDEPFADSGAWQFEHALIRLDGDDGSLRSYELLGDGRLESRQLDGSLDPQPHVLQPVAGVHP